MSVPCFVSTSQRLLWRLLAVFIYQGFTGDTIGNGFSCSAGDADSIPGMQRFPEGGNVSPLQFSSLGNPMD